MADQFKLDYTRVTLRDLEVVEGHTGLGSGDFFAEMERIEGLVKAGTFNMQSGISTAMLTAMVYIAGRQQDPVFTIDDAADLSLTEIASVFQGGLRQPAAPITPLRPAKQKKAGAPAKRAELEAALNTAVPD